MTARFAHSTDEIKARLELRAVELANICGLFGRQQGANYWVKDPRRVDGGNLTSFSINTARGFFKNFAAYREAGDLLRLIAIFKCGGDDRKSIDWALDWLGLTDKAPDPGETAALVARAKTARAEEEKRAAARRKAALKIWHYDGVPLNGRDPASLYLKARGIDVLALPKIPSALRFVPQCMALPEDVKLPAMVANVSGAKGFMACHRTYLECHAGVWRKAWTGETRDRKKIPAKRALGEYVGGSIRLTRGISGKPLAQAPDGEQPVIGEGIENVLTSALAKPELRHLASVSLSNLGNVDLPAQIRSVYLLQDNDTEPQAIDAFHRAMDNYAARGIEPWGVRVEGFKDLNQVLQGAA